MHCASVGLFNGEAVERIKKSALEKVVVCNTIPLSQEKRTEKIAQLSVAHILAQAIDRIQTIQSVSSLFKK